MSATVSQITSLTIVYLTVYSGADQRKHQRKHQSSTSLAFVSGISPMTGEFPHKWPATRKRFPFDDVIMVVRVPRPWLFVAFTSIITRYILIFYFSGSRWRHIRICSLNQWGSAGALQEVQIRSQQWDRAHSRGLHTISRGGCVLGGHAGN